MRTCYTKLAATSNTKPVKTQLNRVIDIIEHISIDGLLDESRTKELFSIFPHLKHLYAYFEISENIGTGGFNKYRHTLKLARNYYILKELDLNKATAQEIKIAHDNFFRPEADKLKTATKEDIFSFENFKELVRRQKEIIQTDAEEYIFISWLFAHDYGTAILPDGSTKSVLNVSHHSPWSGYLAFNEFKGKFKQLELDITELVITNHSYFGDLSVGESDFKTYDILQTQTREIIEKNHNPPIAWEKICSYLILLNIIDTNSTNAGSSLYNELFVDFMSILDGQFFNMTPEQKFKKRLELVFGFNRVPMNVSQTELNYENFLERFMQELTNADLADSFQELYFQYLAGIFNKPTENNSFLKKDSENPGHILAERFIKQLCVLWKETRQMSDQESQKYSKQNWFDFIVFENGKTNNLKINELLAKRCQQYSVENCFDKDRRTFLGIPYVISLQAIQDKEFDDRFLSLKIEEEYLRITAADDTD